MVGSSQALSRTNKNFRSRFRFRLRLDTWTDYKPMQALAHAKQKMINFCECNANWKLNMWKETCIPRNTECLKFKAPFNWEKHLSLLDCLQTWVYQHKFGKRKFYLSNLRLLNNQGQRNQARFPDMNIFGQQLNFSMMRSLRQIMYMSQNG